MVIFRAGRFGVGAVNLNGRPLILTVVAGSLFLTLESSFLDFLLAEDDSFIVT
jgi:hypothetical protein